MPQFLCGDQSCNFISKCFVPQLKQQASLVLNQTVALNLNIDYISRRLLLFAVKNTLNCFLSVCVFSGQVSRDCNGNEAWTSF